MGENVAIVMFYTHVRLHSLVPPTPEPVPLPRILVQSLSITPRWCSIILECRAAGVTEDLNVTWESKGLPRELEQKGTPGPAPNSWTLAVNLPLHQPSASLTCVVSNSEDQKTVTSALGEVCAHGEYNLLVVVGRALSELREHWV